MSHFLLSFYHDLFLFNISTCNSADGTRSEIIEEDLPSIFLPICIYGMAEEYILVISMHDWAHVRQSEEYPLSPSKRGPTHKAKVAPSPAPQKRRTPLSQVCVCATPTPS